MKKTCRSVDESKLEHIAQLVPESKRSQFLSLVHEGRAEEAAAILQCSQTNNALHEELHTIQQRLEKEGFTPAVAKLRAKQRLRESFLLMVLLCYE